MITATTVQLNYADNAKYTETIIRHTTLTKTMQPKRGTDCIKYVTRYTAFSTVVMITIIYLINCKL